MQMKERFCMCGRTQSGQPIPRPQRRQRMERIHGICCTQRGQMPGYIGDNMARVPQVRQVAPGGASNPCRRWVSWCRWSVMLLSQFDIG
ncbi:hypothetical protein [Paenibacillus sp. BIC5C1]|uniref:hypothetical protein n=1 Tax=Paenibacillus sp. BIC5C1 TaxID=3078263 RepID=UPI0028E63A48|nr:hypothetical protein [Paenibacillus sp. BIC5C1]